MLSPAISTIGMGLNRPECVLTHSSGLVFVPNCSNNGGVSAIDRQGKTQHLYATNTMEPIKPNGIAIDANGHFLLAHLGEHTGGIFRLNADGKLETVVTHANGHPLPPTNFVVQDSQQRLWITVSTRKSPRANDYRAQANSGFIALAHPGQTDATIVADNLGYTNECFVDLDQSALYVNETFTRQLSRFDLLEDGSLSNKTIVTTFGKGTFPDGLNMDENGDFWVTSIVSNRVIKVTPDGQQSVILEDSDPDFLDATETAYEADQLNTKHLSTTGRTTLTNISSMAFGGLDGKTVYLGNLLGDCLHTFEANVVGRRPYYWDAPLDNALSKLADLL